VKLLVAAATLLTTGTALAGKVDVSGKWQDGRPLRGATILILDSDGARNLEMMATGVTDATGKALITYQDQAWDKGARNERSCEEGPASQSAATGSNVLPATRPEGTNVSHAPFEKAPGGQCPGEHRTWVGGGGGPIRRPSADAMNGQPRVDVPARQ
jgi:hypothetical protein